MSTINEFDIDTDTFYVVQGKHCKLQGVVFDPTHTYIISAKHSTITDNNINSITFYASTDEEINQLDILLDTLRTAKKLSRYTCMYKRVEVDNVPTVPPTTLDSINKYKELLQHIIDSGSITCIRRSVIQSYLNINAKDATSVITHLVSTGVLRIYHSAWQLTDTTRLHFGLSSTQMHQSIVNIAQDTHRKYNPASISDALKDLPK